MKSYLTLCKDTKRWLNERKKEGSQSTDQKTLRWSKEEKEKKKRGQDGTEKRTEEQGKEKV